ncbi:hypothetical protein OAH34_01980 [bacterium]|nr:hypothetical protein [bacterium]
MKEIQTLFVFSFSHTSAPKPFTGVRFEGWPKTIIGFGQLDEMSDHPLGGKRKTTKLTDKLRSQAAGFG